MSKIKSLDSSYSDRRRMKKIIEILREEYPDVKIQLDFVTPHELLVATILSAQCTDARVNIVTKSLFKKYRRPEDYLTVPQEELEKDIFSTGYYKAKAKHIQAATSEILEKFNGSVPDNMDDLLSLPGVGRKTANVILGHCFNVPGIVVDTHVIRISNKLGFAETTDAVKIEKILNQLVPKNEWVIFTHFLINHGRNTCISRKPKCEKCRISSLCPSAFK
jgi:endonuclease III